MPRRHTRNEEGALLIILMVGVAVTMVGLAVAFQTWSTIWRRDNEEELIFRGKQYVIALRAYQKERSTLPLNLEELMKPGPRQVRYIRKLFKDPMKKNAKWGLLYLVPGQRAIYDPVAAQKSQKEKEKSDSGWGTPRADDARGPSGGGFTSFTDDPNGAGVQNPGFGGGGLANQNPGMGNQPPHGGAGRTLPGGVTPRGSIAVAPPPPAPSNASDEKAVSETPIGWQIAGVISRVIDSETPGASASSDGSGEASAVNSTKLPTFKIFRGHDHVDEWQFHVYDTQPDLAQAPQLGTPGGSPAPFLGPGFGGNGPIGGMGGGARAPGFGGRGQMQGGGQQNNWFQGGQKGSNPRQ